MSAAQSPRGIAWMRALALALMIANVCQAAKIVDVFWSDASRVAYAVQILVVLVFMIVALYRGDLLVLAFGIGLTAWLVWSQLLFSFNTHSHVNLDAIATYAPLLTLIALYHFDLKPQQLLRLLFWVSLGYLVFYVLASSYILTTPSAVSVVLKAHDDAGEGRVYLSAPYAAFVAFYGLKVERLRLLARVALVVLSLYAVVLSDSRTYLLIFLAVFLIALAGWLTPRVRSMLLVAVLGGMGVILAGVLLPWWNPFDTGSTDSSAVYRAREYVAAMQALRVHWLFGIGTASDFDTLQAYLGTPRFEPLYASDLGIVAPFLEFGLVGLVAFAAAACFSLLARLDGRVPEEEALQLTCIANAIMGIISPMMLYEPCSLFLMMLLAIWMRQRRSEARRREPLFDHLFSALA